MEKRTLLALALSFLVLGFYPLLLEKFYPGYQTQTQETKSVTGPPNGASDPSSAAETIPKTSLNESSFSPSGDVAFQNERVRLLWSKRGGVVREISFSKFTDSEKKEAIKFISSKNAPAAPFFIRWVGADRRWKEDTDYQVAVRSGEISVLSNPMAPLSVTKRYTARGDGYGADIKLDFRNNTDASFTFRYQLGVGSGIIPRHSIDSQYIEANFFSSGAGKGDLKHIRETKLGKTVESQAPLEWVALKDRHFSIIVKPRQGQPFSGLVQGLGDHDLSVSLVSPETTIPPHDAITHDFLVYIGPNELEELIPLGLDPIINFGKLDAIGRLLVGGLELCHKVFRNYGVAIIALTLFINLLFFPLTRASFMSMKRMQLIQPHMSKVKEQHKKNPEKLNKEMMELYKKHKVNPFGGCLPMLLQMPVFMALYVALSKSVMLINSKFLWVNDLSSPDSLGLPFALPFLGSELHVLPLIMVAAMVIQQKFTQVKVEGQDPTIEQQQKMMTVMMPILFGFIFYAMPSGLVLYWLTNTLLMTFYQLHLKRVTLT